MNINRIMSRKIVSVEMDDPLKVIKEIFDHTRFHHLLVIESERLMGVISDRDLLKALSPRIGTLSETEHDAVTLKKRAHQIMSHHPITLPSSADIFDAVKMFNQHSISCIPVVDDQQRPLGILSWHDILRLVEERWEIIKHRDER